MDAMHFRLKAARARDMARLGEDPKLAQMLLEVAADLDAEADTIEHEERLAEQMQRLARDRATLCTLDDTECCPVQIIAISPGGAKLRFAGQHFAGSPAVLTVHGIGLRIAGTLVGVNDRETAMVFDDQLRAAPELERLLRPVMPADLQPMLA